MVVVQGLQLFGEDNLKASDWMAIEQAEQDAQADRMVVLSDVWLDKPEVLDQLHTVFSGNISHILVRLNWLQQVALDVQLKMLMIGFCWQRYLSYAPM